MHGIRYLLGLARKQWSAFIASQRYKRKAPALTKPNRFVTSNIEHSRTHLGSIACMSVEHCQHLRRSLLVTHKNTKVDCRLESSQALTRNARHQARGNPPSCTRSLLFSLQ